jgi:hypothetical protein
MSEPEAVANVVTQLDEMVAKLKAKFPEKEFTDEKEKQKHALKAMEAMRDGFRSIKVSQCPAEFQTAWKEYVKGMEQMFDMMGEMQKMEDGKDGQEKGMEMLGKFMAVGMTMAQAQAKVSEIGEKYAPGFTKKLESIGDKD